MIRQLLRARPEPTDHACMRDDVVVRGFAMNESLDVIPGANGCGNGKCNVMFSTDSINIKSAVW